MHLGARRIWKCNFHPEPHLRHHHVSSIWHDTASLIAILRVHVATAIPRYFLWFLVPLVITNMWGKSLLCETPVRYNTTEPGDMHHAHGDVRGDVTQARR